MKRFKEHVKEDLNTMGVGVTTSNSPEDGNIGAHNIQDPAVLQKVNAYVGSIGDGEYINPQGAVEQLKMKLNTIGLDFDAKLDGPSGSITAEMTQYGGRMGKDTDGTDLDDDGISHRKADGMKIEIKHETLQNGSSKVYAKLV